ncbi:MAG: site-specific integrase [Gemmatimonadota bacterium]|nr:site-specific integrase [Gemmatimonadota bacterium]
MNEAGLPQLSGAHEGQAAHADFDPAGDVWRVRSTANKVCISFTRIRASWGDLLTDRVKEAALAYFEGRSASTVSNAISALARMACHVSVGNAISSVSLMNYRALLGRGRHHWLGHVAAFLKFWVARGYPGVDPDVLQFFAGIRIPGNVKGTDIRTHHPTRGPFTDLELQAIVAAAREAHRTGAVRRQDYAILLTLTATGARPGQVSMLVCDDLVPSGGAGSSVRRLLVPSLKKRTSRRLTRERAIPGELAHLLGDLVEQRRRDGRLQGIAAGQRPIFASGEVRFASIRDAHVGRDGVARALERIHRATRLRSGRTGAPVVLSAKRFRTTLGTRAAEAGHPPAVIADLLDHTDLQHVGVYVEARPSIVGRMDAALHDRLEPLVGLFRGAIVPGEESSGVEAAASRRVAADDGGGVGTCGGSPDCARLAPLACYTCAAFRPWRDAPHGQLLQSLLDERAALLADGVSPRVAGANDATMVAIAEVAGRCREMPSEGGDA